MGMVGEACLPSNAYYPRTPDYTLYSGVHVCWSEHSDSSFVYEFMSLDYGLGTMTATTFNCFWLPTPNFLLSTYHFSFEHFTSYISISTSDSPLLTLICRLISVVDVSFVHDTMPNRSHHAMPGFMLCWRAHGQDYNSPLKLKYKPAHICILYKETKYRRCILTR